MDTNGHEWKAVVVKLLAAAANMDWQQVVLNGGPPCFCLGEDGTFCGRAKRWHGHWVLGPGDEVVHEYVSLVTMMRELVEAARQEGKDAEYYAHIVDCIAGHAPASRKRQPRRKKGGAK